MREVNSHFAYNPTNVNIRRSTFDRSQDIKFTCNTGKLIPFFWDEALPGDTYTVDTSILSRMSTPIHPVMDDMFLDVYYFAIPERLTWDHWEEFNGQNDDAWAQQIDFELPQINVTTPYRKGSAADYLGIPTQVTGFSVRADVFRAYALVWNEWFRDQNLQDSCFIDKGDSARSNGSPGNTAYSFLQNAIKGTELCPVNKFHDYFTSALPEPLKGPDVFLPIALQDNAVDVYGTMNMGEDGLITNDEGLVLQSNLYNANGENKQNWSHMFSNHPGGDAGVNNLGNFYRGGELQRDEFYSSTNVISKQYADFLGIDSNLKAYFSPENVGTISQLRLAFAVQRLYERDARGGTRYTELLRSHFGVVSPDSRLQRPEYLGGKRLHVNMQQVLQTSATNEVSPQGNTAAYSLTADRDSSFTKSFTEHTIILGLCCFRPRHTYQYGLERAWSRKSRFDFYWPALANISEQPVYNKEIYLANDGKNDEPFGYNEAWAEYRFKPSRVAGAFRSNYEGSLDVWHYADKYTSRPYLNGEWIQETATNVDRTLAVSSEVEDQFICDFFVKMRCVRPMPPYSVPGLLDHN